MPYNRFSYGDLTAQLNVLSHLANALYTIEQPGPSAKKAIALFSGRIRTEINRVARNRRKMKGHTPDQFDLVRDSDETSQLTLS